MTELLPLTCWIFLALLLFLLQELGGNAFWLDRLLAQFVAFFYYFMTVGMYIMSPRMACEYNIILSFNLHVCLVFYWIDWYQNIRLFDQHFVKILLEHCPIIFRFYRLSWGLGLVPGDGFTYNLFCSVKLFNLIIRKQLKNSKLYLDLEIHFFNISAISS